MLLLDVWNIIFINITFSHAKTLLENLTHLTVKYEYADIFNFSAMISSKYKS